MYEVFHCLPPPKKKKKPQKKHITTPILKPTYDQKPETFWGALYSSRPNLTFFPGSISTDTSLSTASSSSAYLTEIFWIEIAPFDGQSDGGSIPTTFERKVTLVISRLPDYQFIIS